MEDNFIWDYGDGSPEDTALNGNHSYIGSLGYWVKLSATFKNWRGNTCKADSSSFLDVGNVKANFQYTSNQKLVSFTDKSLNAKSWEWDFGDGSLKSIQTNPSHLYATYGIYAVKLKVRNKGCVDSSIFVVNLKQSGIDEGNEVGLTAEISPNPARNEFNISTNLSESNEGLWSLYTIQGSMIKQGKLVEKTSVTVDELDPGVYFVRLESGRAVLTRRLVIQ
jgi:PKD repeat protein